jgi:uncharacterized protein
MDKPRPILDELSRPYWDAAANGRLLIQRCTACGRYQWYPRVLCTSCHATSLEYVPAAGNGRIHTYTVLEKTANPEFAADLPYVFAIVELDEGVRVSANIVDTATSALGCGLAVRVVFRPAGDTSLPCFTAAA